MTLCDEVSDILDLEVSEDSGLAVLRATGEVDVASSGCLRSTLARLLGAGRDLVLDLQGVRFMDASGIGVLFGAHRLARNLGVRFSLRGPSPAVAKLLKLTGALRVVPIEPDVSCAVG
jgi:anti-sigma B factor antagonist